jgi:mannose-1-phosphate guanylyltransferase
VTRRERVLYAVIIAGGKGERFWPRSTRRMPKQFHRIVTERTMLQETLHRVFPEISKKRVFIAAGVHLKHAVLEQLPEIDEANLIIEPVGRNTAPAIGLASAVIEAGDPEAVIAVLSADHVVETREAFHEALHDGARAAEGGHIVTFGIQPERPATEFGYIEVGERLELEVSHDIYRVKRFREKPSLEQAREYVAAGTYLWNSGMFIFKAGTLLEEIRMFMPDLHQGLLRIRDSLDSGPTRVEEVKASVFEKLESISIDYGVMEKSGRIACLRPRFTWDDVGSWGALDRHRTGDERGNITEGNVVAVDSADNIVLGDDSSLITMVGMRDSIVVKAGERILICHKTADQRIKEAVKRISEKDEYAEYL